MRKLLLFFAISFLCTISSNAQEPFDKKIKPDFGKISAVNIENAESFEFNSQDEIKISGITFYKSGKKMWFIFSLSTV